MGIAERPVSLATGVTNKAATYKGYVYPFLLSPLLLQVGFWNWILLVL